MECLKKSLNDHILFLLVDTRSAAVEFGGFKVYVVFMVLGSTFTTGNPRVESRPTPSYRIIGLRPHHVENTASCPSHDSSVGIALGYGLDDRRSTVRLSAGAGNFSLHHRVQNGSGAHPASYPMGTRGSFPEGKAAGA
jgi:hypothetical protein